MRLEYRRCSCGRLFVVDAADEVDAARQACDVCTARSHDWRFERWVERQRERASAYRHKSR